jgi:hypothetical protein
LVLDSDQSVRVSSIREGDMITFTIKTLHGSEDVLGLVGLEAENIFAALDFSNYKEGTFKVPLYSEPEECTFYSPLGS